jgi:hypothetical protein
LAELPADVDQGQDIGRVEANGADGNDVIDEVRNDLDLLDAGRAGGQDFNPVVADFREGFGSGDDLFNLLLGAVPQITPNAASDQHQNDDEGYQESLQFTHG